MCEPYFGANVPLRWLKAACELSGKTLAVALAVWHISKLCGRSDNLLLTSKTLVQFAVTNRTAKYDALKKLEGEGLIQVDRKPGSCPRITILGA